MAFYICTACGAQHAEAERPPSHCVICEEERQYVPPRGQTWTTFDDLRHSHTNTFREYENGIIGIGSTPAFAIGQRALLVRTENGNILWDCIATLDDATVTMIQGLGGIDIIAISHPHFYTTMVEWARAFTARIHLHAADKEWIMRTDPAIETDLAIALRDTGQLADARIWFERATIRQPPFAEAFMGLGMLLRSTRQHAEAEAIVKRGLDVAPSMPELSMVLGGLCLDRADTANAKVAFARALANAPGHPEALFGFGIALLNEGEFARAAERFRQVVARDAGHVRARLNLAYCLLELGQWDDGVACLRATIKLDRKSCAEVLRMVVSSGRGRFWLKRSAAAEFFGLDDLS